MIPVLIPYTTRHPETEAGAPGWATWIDVSGDPEAYWRVMRDWWARGESFLVIEHDVVCRPDVVEQFLACPEPWCVFGYDDMCHPECQEAWANMLGCTRFRAELIAAVPNAVAGIPEGRRGWLNLCDEIAGDKIGGVPQDNLRPGSVRPAGFTNHWHEPFVHHHHRTGGDMGYGRRSSWST